MIFHPIWGYAGVSIIACGSVEELPSSSDLGTIAIFSSIKLGKVFISSSTPNETSKAGDIWIVPSASGGAAFAKNGIVCVFQSMYQYNGTSWERAVYAVYTINGWQTSSLYLLNYADKCSSVTGGWGIYNQYNGISTSNDSGYTMIAVNNGYQPAHIQTKDAIDITPFTRLCASGIINTNLENGNSLVAIHKIKSAAGSPGTMSYIATNSTPDAAGAFTVCLDVTAYSGAYYVGFTSHDELTLNTVWLEA